MSPVRFNIALSLSEIPDLLIEENSALQRVGETQDPVKAGQWQMPEGAHEGTPGRCQRSVMNVTANRKSGDIQVNPAAFTGEIILPQTDIKTFEAGFHILLFKGDEEAAAVRNDLQRSGSSAGSILMQGGNENQRVLIGAVFEIPAFKKGAGLAGSMII